MRKVRVQAKAFSAEAEATRLTAGRHDIGALVTFTGLCRDAAGTLAALEIEHYPGMRVGGGEGDRRGPGEKLGVGCILQTRHCEPKGEATQGRQGPNRHYVERLLGCFASLAMTVGRMRLRGARDHAQTGR